MQTAITFEIEIVGEQSTLTVETSAGISVSVMAKAHFSWKGFISFECPEPKLPTGKKTELMWAWSRKLAPTNRKFCTNKISSRC